MSATRDKTQKFTFVYSNLYQVYKKEKEAAENETRGLVTARVLKAENLKASPLKVEPFRPAEILSKRLNVVPKPEVLNQNQNHALNSLKDNLKNLNSLHSRLKVMLKELEDLNKN